MTDQQFYYEFWSMILELLEKKMKLNLKRKLKPFNTIDFIDNEDTPVINGNCKHVFFCKLENGLVIPIEPELQYHTNELFFLGEKKKDLPSRIYYPVISDFTANVRSVMVGFQDELKINDEYTKIFVSGVWRKTKEEAIELANKLLAVAKGA